MYDVITADPPWEYSNRHERRKDGKKTRFGIGAVGHYPVLKPKTIAELPVAYCVAPDAFLFLWTTWTHMKEAIEVTEAWGFRYVTAAFVWVKLNPKSMTPFFGIGHYTKSNTEVCLLGVRGRALKALSPSNRISQIVRTDEPILIPHPRLKKHSQKPAIVRHLIDDFVTGRKIELFARDEHPGWDSLGNEIDGRDIRDSLPMLILEMTLRGMANQTEKVKNQIHGKHFVHGL